MTILPCPFCGHKRTRIQKYEGEVWRHCNACLGGTGPCQTVASANRKWNARPSIQVGGVALIAAERQRQITAEGWTPKHDDKHIVGQLAMAAAVYAAPPHERGMLLPEELGWPWSDKQYKPTPDDRTRELVKAGALIAAEIDRLQRAGGGR